MQARTERRLGFVAAIALTTAAFAMPAISTQMAQDTTAPTTLHASVDSMKIELSRLVAFADTATKPVHYE
ncbi:hypothetical protein LQT97_04965 [Brucella pseudogrignonensis]|jgi:heme/copper-type cytochrome/quinol oxidase subunit 4|uniref:Uncharacterized protein n=1 Tax=Brucella anthropi TaxID=529 RepID=A0A656Z278_BRUAN|nr:MULTISPECIES: hypothetical protein [Brucella]KYB44753.1 hypothetical protein AB664_19940 [Brucella anthropi]MBK0020044.1 hypothetical protein [Ochrobactrum sp. S45]MBK0043216.1 hypothetical protein [Ochrobactrum sp. S46]MQP39812.1 hypothetical protein [Ochrobactrum sp. MYb237]ANG95015.1 hypothetical protein A8A54_00025 [Brucella pseudogrignonensis]